MHNVFCQLHITLVPVSHNILEIHLTSHVFKEKCPYKAPSFHLDKDSQSGTNNFPEDPNTQ